MIFSEQLADSRAMRIASASLIVLLFASEFTIMFGPGDLLIHGTIAAGGIVTAIAFALRKKWAGKVFPALCGYCAVKYSIMPAIYLIQGEPWENFHPPIILLMLLIGVWASLWGCFILYSKGVRWKTILLSVTAVVAAYAVQFLAFSPKGAFKGTPQTIAADARASVFRGNITVDVLSAKLDINATEAVELLMRAPTFSFLLDMPLIRQQEELHRDLTKEEVVKTLQAYEFWGEVADAWRKGQGDDLHSIGDRAPTMEKFALDYFFRSFYWAEANRLLKSGTMSKKEVDARAKEFADRQMAALMKQTAR